MGMIEGLKGAARGVSAARDARARQFCKACGYEGPTETHTPGSTWITLLLLLFYVVPGVIYYFWRRSKRHEVCTQCGSRDLVPSDSPMATMMRKQLESTTR